MTASTRLWHYRAMLSTIDLIILRGFIGAAVLGFLGAIVLMIVHVIKNYTPKH